MRHFITILGLLLSIHSFAQHDWNGKNWNKESLGFGCSADGEITEPVLNMTELFMKKQFNKIRQLLNSKIPADQYLATFVLERLKSKKELEIAGDDRQRILEIKNSDEMVPFCSGCTLWTEISMKDLFDEKNQNIVLPSAEHWFKNVYEMYYQQNKNKPKKK